ncbi:MAP kinase kinase Wis1 [Knufia obscura]|uniref:mitogen-activated protein kinase kinase n=2 Tax=Knufia TaxID=430999 RepID=A0AAN8EHA9_9EURO|nr:MAP kinase kinase Wis1 [Knufia obscura]KAK5949590.1 MAP kinase kinase Wis1 [Knufia fluminis]
MADYEQPTAPDVVSTPDSETSTSSDNADASTTSPKPPSLRMPANDSAPTMNSTSSPLGPVNAARRPGPPPPRASNLTSDIQKRMKEMMLSRQGAAQSPRPGMPGSQPPSQNNVQTPGAPAGLATRETPPNLTSPPTASPRMGPLPGRGPMGGLAAKRKGGPVMKLSDAVKPPAEGETAAAQDTGSQFGKFANIVDTQKGTLTFKDKAVVHSSGIDFSNGTNFSISLDEVDTLEELGKGNYGTVFKVRHARPRMRKPGQGLRGSMQRQLSTSVNSLDETKSTSGTTGLVMAMKEIRLELDDAKFAQIVMELDILHRCLSPFIIDFYGAFFQEGSVYICLEHMDGGSIDKLYGDGVPEGVLRKITLSTVMGLKYLKDEHNIIHRDVKPTNILVNTKGQVKICDFGVSGNLVASMARTNIGCQSYMAPERISGGGMASAGAVSTGSYSVQSDIWSLALTIIECALGRYPYPPETYNNIFSQLSAIVDGEPPELPAERYSESAREFVKGCLNKIPKMRPTYAALLRHSWLAPLMKPPTIQEDEEAETAAEAGGDASADMEPLPLTADKEVANWVHEAMERKRTGKMASAEKPALHAAPLDQVPGSPMTNEPADAPIAPNPGVRIDSPELVSAKVHSLDFASGVERVDSSEQKTGGDEEKPDL